MPDKSSGFTLIELITSIAVLGILLAIAAPSFNRFMRNIEVRNAAESILSGIQRARAEAVGRNTNVSFTLSNDSSWTVSVVAPAAQIESRPANEGSQNVTRTITGSATITFNNLGIIANAEPLQQIDFSAEGSNRPLRVTIGAGGNARLCDPAGSGPNAC
jgi:type IV fimbrial biogenesis protein FimT